MRDEHLRKNVRLVAKRPLRATHCRVVCRVSAFKKRAAITINNAFVARGYLLIVNAKGGVGEQGMET